MAKRKQSETDRRVREVADLVLAFQKERDCAIASATLPKTADTEGISFGRPPFIVHDGDGTYFAILLEDGAVKPLPYDYKLDPNTINSEESNAVFSHIAGAPIRTNMLCYEPVKSSIKLPTKRDFQFERLCEEWEKSKYELDGLKFDGEQYFDAETGEPHTGSAKMSWPNGTQRKEAHLRDGRLNGKLTWWYPNGQKELEDYYSDNIRHGLHRTWHENGERWAEGEILDGKRQGLHRWWHINGRLAEECTYQHDFEQGPYKKWYDNGILAIETNFDRGQENGLHKEWHESGDPKLEVEISDGEFHGTARIWSETGQLFREIQFEHGEQIDAPAHGLDEHAVALLRERIESQIGEEGREQLSELFAMIDTLADDDNDVKAHVLKKLVDIVEDESESQGRQSNRSQKVSPTSKRKAKKRYCAKCGVRRLGSAKACQNCGETDVQNKPPRHSKGSQEDRRYCAKCGVRILGSASQCQNCGQPDGLTRSTRDIGGNAEKKRYCAKCGVRILGSASRCQNCGDKKGLTTPSRDRSGGGCAPVLFLVVAIVAVLTLNSYY